jgi:glycosylphosphatidylinositol deacylase
MSASRRVALGAAALALAALAAVWAHILSPSFGGANLCEMTYMRPGYLPVPLPASLANDRGYALFLYREGMTRVSEAAARREVSKLGEPGPDGTRATPAIFLPGNGGSFKQVRSVAAESRRVERERATLAEAAKREDGDVFDAQKARAPRLDWFAVSFGEELSAFHGALLEDQTAFAARVVEHVASMYASYDAGTDASEYTPTKSRKEPEPTHVVLLGHSMGGLVARGALLDDALQKKKSSLAVSLVTLASPHAYSPATTTMRAARRHARLNEAWRLGYAEEKGSVTNVALASVTGGDRDRQVLASHADLKVGGVVDARFGFAVDAGDVPGAFGVSADHQCVLWCNQIIKAVANAVLDAAHVQETLLYDGKMHAGGGVLEETATAARRAALAARLAGDSEQTTRTFDDGFFSFTTLTGFARWALRWTPSLVPATVAVAFALAGSSSPRVAARRARGDDGALFVAGGAAAFVLACLACAWLPAAGAAAGAVARVVFLFRSSDRTRDERRDVRRTYRCVAHAVAALAALPSAFAALHAAANISAASNSPPIRSSGAVTKARAIRTILLASPFMRGDEDTWWALAAAAPAWLERFGLDEPGDAYGQIDSSLFRPYASPGGGARHGGALRRRRGGGGRGGPGARARDAGRRRAGGGRVGRRRARLELSPV